MTVILVMGINPLQRANDLENVFSIMLNKRRMSSSFPNLRTKLVRNHTSPDEHQVVCSTASTMQEYALCIHHNFVEVFYKHK